MADFLDFLLASPVKSPAPLEITATTTLEDVIAATIQPETTNQAQPETITTTQTDDEALAAEILAEATAEEPEPVTETRLSDSLTDLLGPPPTEKPLYSELTILLKAELKLQTRPDTLLKLLRPKMSVFAREQQLQLQFTKLETTHPTEISQLSSFFKYQSAVIETERYQALHQSATKPQLQYSINSHYDNQLHKAIDRVEVYNCLTLIYK